MNSYCQKLPPNTAASRSSTTPTPIQPSCASPPPTTMGVPSFSPVSSAALSMTFENSVPDSTIVGNISGSNPNLLIISLSQSLNLRLTKPVVEALDGSQQNSPLSLYISQSLNIVIFLIFLYISGFLFFIQSKRGIASSALVCPVFL